MTTTQPVTSGVRRQALDHATAMRLAATEYDRVLAVLRTLPTAAWSGPSGCGEWTVQQLVSHMVGMAEMSASMREQVRQLRAARAGDGVFLDNLTGLQVSERADQTPAQLIARWAEVAPKALRGRAKTPGFLRGRALPMKQTAGPLPGAPVERWSVGFLVDIISTRDPWMHRTELCQAGGVPLELTPDHDGILIADVAREWADRHGQPCRLVLTGPAGGHWEWGQDGPALELDAVEFCRILSARGSDPGLLSTPVPF